MPNKGIRARLDSILTSWDKPLAEQPALPTQNIQLQSPNVPRQTVFRNENTLDSLSNVIDKKYQSRDSLSTLMDFSGLSPNSKEQAIPTAENTQNYNKLVNNYNSIDATPEINEFNRINQLKERPNLDAHFGENSIPELERQQRLTERPQGNGLLMDAVTAPMTGLVSSMGTAFQGAEQFGKGLGTYIGQDEEVLKGVGLEPKSVQRDLLLGGAKMASGTIGAALMTNPMVAKLSMASPIVESIGEQIGGEKGKSIARYVTPLLLRMPSLMFAEMGADGAVEAVRATDTYKALDDEEKQVTDDVVSNIVLFSLIPAMQKIGATGKQKAKNFDPAGVKDIDISINKTKTDWDKVRARAERGGEGSDIAKRKLRENESALDSEILPESMRGFQTDKRERGLQIETSKLQQKLNAEQTGVTQAEFEKVNAKEFVKPTETKPTKGLTQESNILNLNKKKVQSQTPEDLFKQGKTANEAIEILDVKPNQQSVIISKFNQFNKEVERPKQKTEEVKSKTIVKVGENKLTLDEAKRSKARLEEKATHPGGLSKQKKHQLNMLNKFIEQKQPKYESDRNYRGLKQLDKFGAEAFNNNRKLIDRVADLRAYRKEHGGQKGASALRDIKKAIKNVNGVEFDGKNIVIGGKTIIASQKPPPKDDISEYKDYKPTNPKEDLQAGMDLFTGTENYPNGFGKAKIDKGIKDLENGKVTPESKVVEYVTDQKLIELKKNGKVEVIGQAPVTKEMLEEIKEGQKEQEVTDFFKSKQTELYQAKDKPLSTPSKKELDTELAKVNKYLPKWVNIKLDDKIVDANGKPALGSWKDGEISINPKLVNATTLPHEITHQATKMVFAQQPYRGKVLLKLNGWDGKGDPLDTKLENVKDAWEGIAKKGESYLRDEDGFMKSEPHAKKYKRFFDKLKELWESVRNWLKGSGFASESKLFNDMAKGKFKDYDIISGKQKLMQKVLDKTLKYGNFWNKSKVGEYTKLEKDNNNVAMLDEMRDRYSGEIKHVLPPNDQYLFLDVDGVRITPPTEALIKKYPNMANYELSYVGKVKDTKMEFVEMSADGGKTLVELDKKLKNFKTQVVKATNAMNKGQLVFDRYKKTGSYYAEYNDDKIRVSEHGDKWVATDYDADYQYSIIDGVGFYHKPDYRDIVFREKNALRRFRKIESKIKNEIDKYEDTPLFQEDLSEIEKAQQMQKWANPKKEVKPKPQDEIAKLGLKKEDAKLIRKIKGFEKLDPYTKITVKGVIKEVLDNNLQAKAHDLSKIIVENPRVLTPHEWISLEVRKAEIDEELATLGKSDTRRVDWLLEEYDLITEATSLTSSLSGQSQQIRQVTLTEDFSPQANLARARRKKGSQLLESEKAKVNELSDKLEKSKGQLDKMYENYIAEKREKEKILAERITKLESRKASKRQTKLEKIYTERESLKNDLRDLGFRVNDVVGVTAEGYYKLAKYVNNYIKEAVEKTGENAELEDIIKSIQKDIPDISANDIHRALNTTKPSVQAKAKTEAEKKITLIKREARLKDKIRQLEEEVFSVTPPKARISNDKVVKLDKLYRLLRKSAYETITDGVKLDKALTTLNEVTDALDTHSRRLRVKRKPDPVELAEIKKKTNKLRKQIRNEDLLSDLEQQIKDNKFEVPDKFIQEVYPKDLNETEAKVRVARKRIKQYIDSLEPKTTKDKALHIAHMARTTKATLDVSAAGRQAWLAMVDDPKQFGKNYFSALQGMINETSYETIQRDIENHPNQIIRDAAGLKINDIHNLGFKEEMMQGSKGLQDIPIYGKAIKASDRNMTVMLNLTRATMFDRFLKLYPNATMKELKSWADYVNITTGVGTIKAGSWSNFAFFAPRFSWSRIEYPYQVFKHWKEPRVKKEILKNLGKNALLGATMLTLAGIAGAELTSDYTDPDFGKIKVGNTRIDVFAGALQPMRLSFQLASIIAGKSDRSMIDLTMQFSKYKLSPALTLTNTLATGKDMVGNKYTPLEALGSSIMPMVFEELADAYKDAGLTKTMILALPIISGVGTSTYDSFSGDIRRIEQNVSNFKDISHRAELEYIRDNPLPNWLYKKHDGNPTITKTGKLSVRQTTNKSEVKKLIKLMDNKDKLTDREIKLVERYETVMNKAIKKKTNFTLPSSLSNVYRKLATK